MAFKQDLASTLDRVAELEEENRRLKGRIGELERDLAFKPSPVVVTQVISSNENRLRVLGICALAALGLAIIVAAFYGLDWVWRGLMAGMRE